MLFGISHDVSEELGKSQACCSMEMWELVYKELYYNIINLMIWTRMNSTLNEKEITVAKKLWQKKMWKLNEYKIEITQDFIENY